MSAAWKLASNAPFSIKRENKQFIASATSSHMCGNALDWKLRWTGTADVLMGPYCVLNSGGVVCSDPGISAATLKGHAAVLKGACKLPTGGRGAATCRVPVPRGCPLDNDWAQCSRELQAVGASYGVYCLVKDKAGHWSLRGG